MDRFRQFFVRACQVSGSLALCAGAMALAHGAEATRNVNRALPSGVTLEVIMKAPADRRSGMRAEAVSVITRADGMAIYTHDQDRGGQSLCTGECARLWPPLVVGKDRDSRAGWSQIRREDGSWQRTYLGMPLYVYSKDLKAGERKGDGEGGIWHVAVYQTAPGPVAPDGISARWVGNANAEAFTDHEGRTLYSLVSSAGAKTQCVGDCARIWSPLSAPMIAKSLGDFSVVSRPDSSHQWAYRGSPLFRFVGDTRSGDANGQFTEPSGVPAVAVAYYIPSGIRLSMTGKHGAIFTTASGQTLYARDKHRFAQGGHASGGEPPPTTDLSRAVGLAGCDARCVRTWPPLEAPKDAEPADFWSVVTRPEGTRQWAYQGYPLYTYTGDSQSGEINGFDLFDYVDGATALYWRLAKP